MTKSYFAKTVIGTTAILMLTGMTGTIFKDRINIAHAMDTVPIALNNSPTGDQAAVSASTIELFGVFNPNHLYLSNGTVSISATAGSVTVTATTTAGGLVDSIGITFYLQKLNGGTWENVGSGTATGGNNAVTYSNTFSKSVTAGTTYRARTVHWVSENGVYEEGERFSNSIVGK
ncbi:hypothetical protein [Cohnella herbarum]|uniref:Uncharacterized protein n=1 Tax=Cohnella herbarum TaxID=2728023 RepID=A0A7Z2ZPM7_9BACL|nr:hypothetical protein [Cohnella herbarum]QJD87080.1 hypothetical protein HH215_30495 [Cohnella herbarum]